MANMIVENGKFILTQIIDSAGTLTHTLQTQNTFVDKNIEIATNVPSAVLTGGATVISATDAENILTESQTEPVSGEYITISGQASASATTGGWVDQGDSVQSTPASKYYTIQNATFSVSGPSVVTTQKGYVGNNVTVGTISTGQQTISGGTLTAGSNSSSLSSDGYYNGSSYDTTDVVTLESSEASGYYKVTTAASATVNSAAVTKQVTVAGYFAADNSAVEAIAADSINVTVAPHPYFIKKSTLSANSISSSSTQQTITIGEGYYPTDRTITVDPMAEISPVTSLANVGLSTYFVEGTSSLNDVTLTPQYSTSSAGYVSIHTNTNNGGVEYYKIKTTTITEGTTTVSGSTATRGTASWGTGWITTDTMDVATFANSATSGETYVDISDTSDAPILVAGGYLFINKGYTDNLKISLAKLVPNGSDVKGHSEYILSGHSAYDNDGILVAGSIPTYTGAYTVS